MTTRAAAVQAGLRLEYFTIGWNFLEAAIALACGAVAGSIALTGFGLDSLIEVSSAGVLLWRLHADSNDKKREEVELRALKLVGLTLLALAAYVGVDSVLALLRREAPERSLPGIVLAIASLVAMPILAGMKRRVALSLRSDALHADSQQTDICAGLSAVLLLGLSLHAAFGWWWADAMAALLMVPIIAYEGAQALQGKACCRDCR